MTQVTLILTHSASDHNVGYNSINIIRERTIKAFISMTGQVYRFMPLQVLYPDGICLHSLHQVDPTTEYPFIK